jgi:hypothetical protein
MASARAPESERKRPPRRSSPPRRPRRAAGRPRRLCRRPSRRSLDVPVGRAIGAVLPCADPEDNARAAPRPDDYVVRPGGAVQRPLLAFDDGERLSAEHEEVLLIGLPVVHRHRLARFEHGETDAELQEHWSSTFEARPLPLPHALPPGGLAGVQDEPAVPGGEEARPPSVRTELQGPRPEVTAAYALAFGEYLGDRSPGIPDDHWFVSR